MSSALRSYAQAVPNTSFLLTTVSGTTLFQKNAKTDSVVSLSLEVADLSAGVIVGANTLLRDMGRSLTLYLNTNGDDGRAVKVAVLREVQRVNGRNMEGVSDTRAYLVPVWVDEASDSIPTPAMAVQVVRCG